MACLALKVRVTFLYCCCTMMHLPQLPDSPERTHDSQSNYSPAPRIITLTPRGPGINFNFQLDFTRWGLRVKHMLPPSEAFLAPLLQTFNILCCHRRCHSHQSCC